MARTYQYSDADIDVRQLLPKVTDNVMSDVNVTFLIDIVDDIIDGKLVYMYTVPFTSTPPIVRRISTYMAAYLVLMKINAKSVGSPEGEWINVYKEFADTMLEGIVTGSIMLVDANGAEIAHKTDYGMRISTADYVPIFNEGTAFDWEIDQDKVKADVEGR